MNRYIAQGDGFPADNEFLMLIQSIIGEVSQLAAIGGSNYIIRGCEVIGGNVSAGWLVLDGEILPLQAGPVGARVSIVETVEQATYIEDVNQDGLGDSKPTYFYRKAVLGANGSHAWSEIEKSPLAELKRRLPPIDCPLPYKGNVNNIPEGWVLYEPLQGQFVVGYDPNDDDYDEIGKTGGAKEVTLTAAQMPVHKHTGSTSTSGSHNHSVTGYSKQQQSVDNGGGSVVADSVGNAPNTGSAGAHSHGINLNNAGGGQAHENRPTYYVLAWIHYVGS